MFLFLAVSPPQPPAVSDGYNELKTMGLLSKHTCVVTVAFGAAGGKRQAWKGEKPGARHLAPTMAPLFQQLFLGRLL